MNAPICHRVIVERPLITSSDKIDKDSLLRICPFCKSKIPTSLDECPICHRVIVERTFIHVDDKPYSNESVKPPRKKVSVKPTKTRKQVKLMKARLFWSIFAIILIAWIAFATFKTLTKTYTITASVGSSGSISPSGSVIVKPGSNESFTITADPSYAISSVTVDSINEGDINTYTFNNVTEDHTISATFCKTYTINATAGSNGSITPSGSVTIKNGESQSFTITANSSYAISSVKVDGINKGAISTYTFKNATATHTISATFCKTYAITASAGDRGTITPYGSVTVKNGYNQSFTITADSSNVISSVTVDGINKGAISAYTFKDVTSNHTIDAAFSVSYSIGSIDPRFNISTYTLLKIVKDAANRWNKAAGKNLLTYNTNGDIPIYLVYDSTQRYEGEEYTVGYYEEEGGMKDIKILSFDNTIELRLILMHEFGHALGLEDNYTSTNSIMCSLLNDMTINRNNPYPTKEDLSLISGF